MAVEKELILHIAVHRVKKTEAFQKIAEEGKGQPLVGVLFSDIERDNPVVAAGEFAQVVFDEGCIIEPGEPRDDAVNGRSSHNHVVAEQVAQHFAKIGFAGAIKT